MKAIERKKDDTILIKNRFLMENWGVRSGPNGELATLNRRHVMESHIFGNAPSPEPRYQQYEPQQQQQTPQRTFSEQQTQELSSFHAEAQQIVPRPNFRNVSASEFIGNSTSALSIPDSNCSSLPPLPDFALPNLPPPEVFDIPKVTNSNPNLYQGKRLSPIKSSEFARLRDQLEKDANDYHSGAKIRTITSLK